MDLKGTQTEKNILKAFAGESQARNRYTFYASVAKKEGFVQISAIFEDTANQEKEHAKKLFKYLKNGSAVEITDSYPAGVIGTTSENLVAAAQGEHHEWTEMYPEFAKTAREEGFEGVAKCLEAIAIAEKHHETRYNAMHAAIEAGKVFKQDNVVIWRCRNCGFLHEANEAPKSCPACAHAQAHFEIAHETWLK